MLMLDAVDKSFGNISVLKDISLKIGEGELIGLVGPSGGGKSVLLKIMGHILDADRGVVKHSLPASRIPSGRQSSGSSNSVGFLFQEGALFDSMTVLENTMFPLIERPTLSSVDSVESVSWSEAYRRSSEILSEVGLANAAGKYPGQLSGGMRRRAALARALVSNPDLVLLDDPTGGLDPVASTIIINLILDLHKHYKPAIIIVSHDIRRLLPNVERVLGLFEGKISCDMSPQEIFHQADPDVVKFLSTRFDFESFGAGSIGK